MANLKNLTKTQLIEKIENLDNLIDQKDAEIENIKASVVSSTRYLAHANQTIQILQTAVVIAAGLALVFGIALCCVL